MHRRAEAAQLDLLPADNLLAIAVTPLHRDVRVGVGVDEHVEGALPGVELGQESHRRGDLAEDGGDLGLDLGFGLFGVW